MTFPHAISTEVILRYLETNILIVTYMNSQRSGTVIAEVDTIMKLSVVTTVAIAIL